MHEWERIINQAIKSAEMKGFQKGLDARDAQLEKVKLTREFWERMRIYKDLDGAPNRP